MGLIDERFNLSDPSFSAWSSLNPETQESEALKMAVYEAMIDRVDQNIERILARLREPGRDQNTRILYQSPNFRSIFR